MCLTKLFLLNFRTYCKLIYIIHIFKINVIVYINYIIFHKMDNWQINELNASRTIIYRLIVELAFDSYIWYNIQYPIY